MALPFFYNSLMAPGSAEHTLDEETSRHIVQVLRMKAGEELNLTNGSGHVFESRIIEAGKKKVSVSLMRETFQQQPPKVSIAISPVKNTFRFEWFLEKATEIGVSDIYPIICSRTEKQHLRHDRLKNILVSAMLQSKQVWLPELHDNISFDKFMSIPQGERFIAHCNETSSKISLASGTHLKDPVILIGPEGDFTTEEISLAMQHNFKPVTLGNTRLRTETAGIVAATLLCIR